VQEKGDIRLGDGLVIMGYIIARFHFATKSGTQVVEKCNLEHLHGKDCLTRNNADKRKVEIITLSFGGKFKRKKNEETGYKWRNKHDSKNE